MILLSRRAAGWAVTLAAWVLLLGACQAAGPPPPVATATPRTFMLLSELQAAGTPATSTATTIVGYLVVRPDGAVLVDGLTFDAGGAVRILDTGSAPVWLGAEALASLRGNLRSAGQIEYASVLARGTLLGPGAYGTGGRYRFQLDAPELAQLPPTETTVGALLDRPAEAQGQLVRVIGGLLVRDTAGLLIDALGPGGIPAPAARQIKLRGPIRDQALLGQLRGAPSGSVRFGQVQIEGVLRGGALVPMAITIVS